MLRWTTTLNINYAWCSTLHSRFCWLQSKVQVMADPCRQSALMAANYAILRSKMKQGYWFLKTTSVASLSEMYNRVNKLKGDVTLWRGEKNLRAQKVKAQGIMFYTLKTGYLKMREELCRKPEKSIGVGWILPRALHLYLSSISHINHFSACKQSQRRQ